MKIRIQWILKFPNDFVAWNIQVCYMMHSLYCDGFLSLPDLMAMKLECFYLSVKTHFILN